MIFKKGDRVRLKDQEMTTIWKGDMLVEGVGDGHSIIFCMHPVSGFGGFYAVDLEMSPSPVSLMGGLLNLVPSQPNDIWQQTSKAAQDLCGPVTSHSCKAYLIPYDSGWSKYNYCSVCDKKFLGE